MDDYDDEYVDRSELDDVIDGLDDVYLPTILFDSGIISLIGTRAAVVYMYLNRYAASHMTSGDVTPFDMLRLCKCIGITPSLWAKAIDALLEHNMIVQGFTLPESDEDDLRIQLRFTHPSEWVYRV